MEAPEQVEAAAADSAPASCGLADAPRPGTEEPEGRAPLRCPYRTHVQQEQAERHAAAAAKSQTSPETSEESEGERSNSSDGRDNGEEMNSDSGASMPTSPSSAQGDQPADQEHASCRRDCAAGVVRSASFPVGLSNQSSSSAADALPPPGTMPHPRHPSACTMPSQHPTPALHSALAVLLMPHRTLAGSRFCFPWPLPLLVGSRDIYISRTFRTYAYFSSIHSLSVAAVAFRVRCSV
jgi:hypothetical protein